MKTALECVMVIGALMFAAGILYGVAHIVFELYEKIGFWHTAAVVSTSLGAVVWFITAKMLVEYERGQWR